jgi:glucose dehydrogenase
LLAGALRCPFPAGLTGISFSASGGAMAEATNERADDEREDAELTRLAKEIQRQEWCEYGRRLGLNACSKLAREQQANAAR